MDNQLELKTFTACNTTDETPYVKSTPTRCPFCESTNLILDSNFGEYLCGNCLMLVR